MQISSAVVFDYRTNIELYLDQDNNSKVSFILDEYQHDQIKAMIFKFYEEHQQRLAEAVARPLPALADFSETES